MLMWCLFCLNWLSTFSIVQSTLCWFQNRFKRVNLVHVLCTCYNRSIKLFSLSKYNRKAFIQTQLVTAFLQGRCSEHFTKFTERYLRWSMYHSLCCTTLFSKCFFANQANMNFNQVTNQKLMPLWVNQWIDAIPTVRNSPVRFTFT